RASQPKARPWWIASTTWTAATNAWKKNCANSVPISGAYPEKPHEHRQRPFPPHPRAIERPHFRRDVAPVGSGGRGGQGRPGALAQTDPGHHPSRSAHHHREGVRCTHVRAVWGG